VGRRRRAPRMTSVSFGGVTASSMRRGGEDIAGGGRGKGPDTVVSGWGAMGSGWDECFQERSRRCGIHELEPTVPGSWPANGGDLVLTLCEKGERTSTTKGAGRNATFATGPLGWIARSAVCRCPGPRWLGLAPGAARHSYDWNRAGGIAPRLPRRRAGYERARFTKRELLVLKGRRRVRVIF
jgi:hypothetical protein